jgi:glycosyltransferase involved in cell wall biosynthesis
VGTSDPAGASLRKRVLWVSHEIPDRDLGGGSIRQYHLLRRLLEHADVDLVLLGKLRDEALRAALGKVVELPAPPMYPVWRRRLGNLRAMVPGGEATEMYLTSPIAEVLRAHLGDTSAYDLVQVEHEQLARLLPPVRSNIWVMTLHNLVSVWSEQRAAVSQKGRVRWVLLSDARRARDFERRIVEQYDLTIAMCEEDVQRLGGSGRVLVVPNGVDLDRFHSTPLPSRPRLLFSGTFNWEPNIDGAEWLCRELFPRIRTRVPGATLVVVGRDPDQRVRNLANTPGAEFHFDVPSIVPFVESARVALVPLRMGSGTRLKALEALAAGRPVAGTSVGLEGLDLRDGVSAAIADDPDELAERVARLCQDNEHAGELVATGRRIVEEHYSWDRIGAAYVDHVLGAVSAQTPRSV